MTVARPALPTLRTVADPHGLDTEDQALADALVGGLEAEVAARPGTRSPVLDAARFPSMPEWMALRKSALALHPLYRAGTVDRLAHGLTADDLAAALPDGRTPRQCLAAGLGPERADRIVADHHAFLGAPMTREARLLMGGCLDARGIRARAAVAGELLHERASRWDDGIAVASVACGAAGPVAESLAVLDADGIPVTRLSLLDRDPMALAAARAIVRPHVDPDRTEIHLTDLVDVGARCAAPLDPFSGDGWDVVDILGLFEYLPDAIAIDLVRRALGASRPGGVVVVANMLAVRPQQVFFQHVIRWPKVIQRSPREFLALLHAAGAAPDAIEHVIPENAPVYAIAAIDVAAG